MREGLDLVGFFTLGLLGGFGHCVGMCAPFVLWVSRRYAPPPAGRQVVVARQLEYGLGRLLTYAALGGLAGALGSAVDLAGSLVGFQRVAAVVAGAVLVLYALATLSGLGPRLATSGGPLFGRVAGRLRNRPPESALVAGILLGLLPCGLVYAAVIAAAASADALRGALGLFLFGLGTLPALLGLSLADELLARRRVLFNRLSIIFLMAMGVWWVWQGLAG